MECSVLLGTKFVWIPEESKFINSKKIYLSVIVLTINQSHTKETINIHITHNMHHLRVVNAGSKELKPNPRIKTTLIVVIVSK